jgi:CDP-glycerol glycerophosphotransferase (TagB/SpsB family)
VLIKSNYYKNIIDFLSAPRLADLLKEYDFELDFKPHPIMASAIGVFTVESDRVHLVSAVEPEDYTLFITDFSSFVFDFAYLRRAILYFVPDDLEFRSGINAYRSLDLPLEEGFGPIVLDVPGALDAVATILRNGGAVDAEFQRREDRFFLPGNQHRKRLRNYLVEPRPEPHRPSVS